MVWSCVFDEITDAGEIDSEESQEEEEKKFIFTDFFFEFLVGDAAAFFYEFDGDFFFAHLTFYSVSEHWTFFPFVFALVKLLDPCFVAEVVDVLDTAYAFARGEESIIWCCFFLEANSALFDSGGCSIGYSGHIERCFDGCLYVE